jgi:hypothetical protein
MVCDMSGAFQVLAGKAAGSVSSVYVFGERNSGTNYVQNLIVKNCVAGVTRARLYNRENQALLGWKHGFPAMLGAPFDVLAVVVYREPLAWLHGMMRNPWHAAAHLHNLTFSQFIRQEWLAVVDDAGFGVAQDAPIWRRELMIERDPQTGLRFANVMRLRTAKNIGFATLDHRFANVLRVTYESVLANPQGFLNALCATYNLSRLPKFDPILHDRATPSRGPYQPKPLPDIGAADLDFIRAELDMAAERALGYTLMPAQAVRAA